MRTTRELLIAAYASFNARDIDAVLETMDRDVDWPNAMEGGRVHGHNGVREYWIRQWGLLDPHVEPVAFRPDATGRTVVDVRQTVRDLNGNILVDRVVQHIYSIRNGLIKSMEIQESGSS